jgi:glycosyltransferase involved in cell wall biosynthesis
VKIAVIYDCLFPHTIGGAERWYRNLAERLSERHEVTYVTRRQWPAEGPGTPFPAIGVSPGGELYAPSGRRRLWPPVRFGIGVFWHLLRQGRSYDAVHTASFPYFSVLAAAFALRLSRSRARLVVDWHEVWTKAYWRSYAGRFAGGIGYAVQALCLRAPDRSFTFSRLVEARLADLGHRAPVTRLSGEYAPDEAARSTSAHTKPPSPPLALAAGRQIAEKRIDAIPAALAAARRELPELRCAILGDGPEHQAIAARARELGVADVIEMRGRVAPEEVMAAMASASCLVHPSEREGFGMVVCEAVSHGTPAVVVAGEENAAVELIEPGVNGFVASSAGAEPLGAAIVAAVRGGAELRRSALAWYEEHAEELSIDSALTLVEASYS